MQTRNKLFSLVVAAFLLTIISQSVSAQALSLPDGGVNFKRKTGTRIGVTDVEIEWDAPGVKGREGKIWGTDVAPFGFTVLGFGSNVESPWRAGANESTTISFTTDVKINGVPLAAGSYGFFIALYADSCTLIFNKNTKGWGSYFYNSSLDVLRVGTRQQKEMKESKERVDYTFSNQTAQSVEVALEWEKWRIPFNVTVDLVKTTLTSIQAQLSGALGFDPPSLEAGANWCLQNNVNYEQALHWMNIVTDPTMGGIKTFQALRTKAGLLTKLNRAQEADSIMKVALEAANITEMHSSGRQLLAQKKVQEAMEVFQKNYQKNKGAWPTNVGMMRGYAAMGNYKKALEHAKLALTQAPDDVNRKFLTEAVQKLAEGKPL
jgi:hypothetical protein